MTDSKGQLELVDYEQLTSTLPYLLAGLEGHTDGNELKSVTIQQASVSGFRIVIRGFARKDTGAPVCVVGFASGTTPGSALLLAEGAYREGLIRWTVDRYAKSSSNGDGSKDESTRLTIRD